MSAVTWAGSPWRSVRIVPPTSSKASEWQALQAATILTGTKPAGVSEADQATYLKEAFHCLSEDPYVEAALWFNNRDRTPGDGELDRYGLKRFDAASGIDRRGKMSTVFGMGNQAT